jgi:hypothetical protein
MTREPRRASRSRLDWSWFSVTEQPTEPRNPRMGYSTSMGQGELCPMPLSVKARPIAQFGRTPSAYLHVSVVEDVCGRAASPSRENCGGLTVSVRGTASGADSGQSQGSRQEVKHGETIEGPDAD